MILLYKLILCHLVGDHVLQLDHIAKSKGNNLYHLLVHCLLYTLPFYIMFGYDWRLLIIFLAHAIVDLLKAKYKKISYKTDQLIHFVTLLIYVL